MKSHTAESVLPQNPRFHLPRDNGLFEPIAFVFVTERMCTEIAHERQLILDGVRQEHRVRQEKLLARYDPQLSLRGFKYILDLFNLNPRG